MVIHRRQVGFPDRNERYVVIGHLERGSRIKGQNAGDVRGIPMDEGEARASRHESGQCRLGRIRNIRLCARHVGNRHRGIRRVEDAVGHQLPNRAQAVVAVDAGDRFTQRDRGACQVVRPTGQDVSEARNTRCIREGRIGQIIEPFRRREAGNRVQRVDVVRHLRMNREVAGAGDDDVVAGRFRRCIIHADVEHAGMNANVLTRGQRRVGPDQVQRYACSGQDVIEARR
ncbi:hypothetical protein SDC9_114118 [bioreactor metagenome]|uniref:Uncharacterized protein n=1 Tax=bioreactor metagenome TaxID=1076179 RepID=A0A645BRF6_9ZZZZ